MSRSLPPRPNLEQLRKQAKDLRKAHRQGDVSVCPILRRLSRFAQASDDEILTAKLSISEAQHALAREYGYPSWPALVRVVKEASQAPDMYLADRWTWTKALRGIYLPSAATAESSALRCALCEKPAVIHETENVSGELVTRHFCAEHADEQIRVPILGNEFLCPLKYSLTVPVTQEQIDRQETISVTLPNGVLRHVRLERGCVQGGFTMLTMLGPQHGESEKYQTKIWFKIMPGEPKREE